MNREDAARSGHSNLNILHRQIGQGFDSIYFTVGYTTYSSHFSQRSLLGLS